MMTSPSPVPLAPLVIVIHCTSLEAVRGQLGADAVTWIVLLPPPFLNETVLSDSENVHGGGAASWLTVTVWPATVSVPDRGVVSGLAAMPIGTVPLPLPLVVPFSVSQESFDAAVHAQVEVVVTSTLDEPAAAPAGIVSGETVYEQVTAAAAWLTVTVWPAIVSVPERGDVSVFWAIVNDTVALPEPVAALVSVIHETFEAAVQPHEDGVVMSTLPEPAAAGAGMVVADNEYEHDTDAAAWFTVNVCPATVSVPERGDASVLAATENCTVPLSVPDAPAVTVSHETSATAVHAHSAVVVTFTDPVVLPAPTDCEPADSEYEQGVDDTPD
jgi:hypothetical protein